MTFTTHAYVGAVAYKALSQYFGVDAPLAAPVCGAVLGSAPDTFDWLGARLGFWHEGWLYTVLHNSRLAIAIEVLLVAPGLHVLADLLVHDPVLPPPGRVPAYDVVVCRVFGKELTRHDVHWLTAEVMVLALTTLWWISL